MTFIVACLGAAFAMIILVVGLPGLVRAARARFRARRRHVMRRAVRVRYRAVHALAFPPEGREGRHGRRG